MSSRERLSWVALAIFLFTLFVFLISRVHQINDSGYSMTVSQSLLDHGSFTLDRYNLPTVYQIEEVDGHRYYHFPPGTPVLSTPFVWIANRFGVSAVNSDGTYNPRGELIIELLLAAFCMAALALIFFVTARLLLPNGWSAIIALGGALGSQVYSTASRALWSDTWGILLLGIVVLMLLAQETGKRRLNAVNLASLLSWMYFVRPTFSVPILAISVYVLLGYRKLLIRYALTGAAWVTGFVFYSWFHFHSLLPSYYRADRLLFNDFWTALAGNLFSPARGLLIYVPVVAFVAYLLVRYWKLLLYKRLIFLSLSIILVHLIVISGFPHWWGGHSFGPRLTTGLVPWIMLLAILSVDAWLRSTASAGDRPFASRSKRLEAFAGAALLLLSVVINTLGATSHASWLWNVRPKDIDEHPERLWDWRQPQFLAGYLPYPAPEIFPLVAFGRIDFSNADGDKYFWYGRNEGPPDMRWAESKAAIVFAVGDAPPTSLKLNITPYLVAGALDKQRVTVSLNEHALSAFTLSLPEAQIETISLPERLLQSKNVLTLDMPDAQSPEKLGVGPDPHPRSLKINWIEFSNTTSGNTPLR